jgi:hypothetical protein
MADVIDKRMKWRVVTEFLTAEEVIPIEIHRRLSIVYGEHTVGVSAVRLWVGRFKSGETEIGDKPRSSRPATAVTAGNMICIDAPTKRDHRVRSHP